MTAPRSAPPDLPGFTLVRGIGGGGFADVFLYAQHRPSRQVAVKVLRREFLTEENLRQFDAEGDLMAAVSAHPNIVTIHAVGLSPDERPYIVMEHYPKDHFGIRARNRLPVAEVLAVGVQVASAVETAHRAGILHRDVKPANILTSAYDRPGLTDFGISGVLREGSVAGTLGVSLAFAAPEVADGSSFGSVAADVYALAATIYTLLAGRSPFWSAGGENSEQQLEARVQGGLVPPIVRSDVPESLERLIRTGLSTDPAARPQSPLALARSLQDVELELRLAPSRIEVLEDIVKTPPGAGDAGPQAEDDEDDDDGTQMRPAIRPVEPRPQSTPPPASSPPFPAVEPAPVEEPDTQLRPPPLEGYTVGSAIGAGATGVVWRASSDDAEERTVAVKRLRVGGPERGLERFRWEASLLADLDHPHALPVFEIVDVDGGIAIVMEHAPGGSLAQLLAELGPLSPGEVVAVAAPVAEALDAAHRRGVLHGDVKPANVLFAADGQPKLSDFGVARRFGRPVMARDGKAGTGAQIAPEILEGRAADPRVDVYGMGMVCYEALTGNLPPAAAMAPSTSTVESGPASLAEVVDRAVAPDPADRYPTAGELARALRSSVPPGEVRLPGRADVPRKPGGKWAVAVTLLVAAAAAGIFGFKALQQPEEAPDGPAGCPSAPRRQVVEGDTDGDGAPTSGVYHLERVEGGACEMVLVITVDATQPGARYQLGKPGDTMFLGDWDCDEIDTPGLYRSSTGETIYFGSWPVVEGEEIPAPSIVRGAPRADAMLSPATADACDKIVLVT